MPPINPVLACDHKAIVPQVGSVFQSLPNSEDNSGASSESDQITGESADGSEGKGSVLGKDAITAGGRFRMVEQVRRIDDWNADAVNWFSKDDALAALKGLESQLISVTTAELKPDPFQSPLFSLVSEAPATLF